jgi:hypothetical protein
MSKSNVERHGLVVQKIKGVVPLINHFFTACFHGFGTIRVDLHITFSAGYFGSF